MKTNNKKVEHDIIILQPCDVMEAIAHFKTRGEEATMTMFDPWYNKGVGGVRPDYEDYINSILKELSTTTKHLYLWGFPEIAALFVKSVPQPLQFQNWITWYYKNNPSVIRGWRSSQQACLHYAIPNAKMFPEHFLNDEQREKLKAGKMRFIPGPTSVIEESLLVGFVGKQQQTGHPAQKPTAVYEKLMLMTTQKGDLVFDPMAGSGTMGEVALKHGRRAILADMSEEYTKLMEKRLGVKRTNFKQTLVGKRPKVLAI